MSLLNQLAKELMILRAFCVLIALSMGVLSPVLANAAQTSSELSASDLALPDGSVPTICFGNGDSNSEHTIHCEICLLSKNPVSDLPSIMGISLTPPKKIGTVKASLSPNSLNDFRNLQHSRAPPLI